MKKRIKKFLVIIMSLTIIVGPISCTPEHNWGNQETLEPPHDYSLDRPEEFMIKLKDQTPEEIMKEDEELIKNILNTQMILL